MFKFNLSYYAIYLGARFFFKVWLLLILCNIFGSTLKSQTNKFSFNSELSAHKLKDSLSRLDSQYQHLLANPNWIKLHKDSTLNMAKNALSVAEKGGDSTAINRWLYRIGDNYLDVGEFQQALYYFARGINTSQKLKDSIMEMYTLRMRGYTYLNISEFEKASKDYTDAILIGERLGNSHFLLETYLNQIELYFQADEEQVLALNLVDIEAMFETAQTFITPDISKDLLASLDEINAGMLLKEGKYEEAILFVKDALSKYDEPEYVTESWRLKLLLAAYLIYWGDTLKAKGQNKIAANKIREAKAIYLNFVRYNATRNNDEQKLLGYVNIGAVNKRMNLLAQTVDTLRLAINLAHKIGQKHQAVRAYRLLSEIYEENALHDSSLAMFKNYSATRDSIANEKSKKAIFASEEIITLERERIKAEQETERQKQQRQTQSLIALIITISLAAVGGYFYYRARTQRRLRKQQGEINRQIVVDLMKEQAIENLNSRLEGQDQERERIARDLHDRLGGTLSATKMHLERLGKKITPELTDPYQETYKLLNLATQETRQISHDMMALPLMQMGFEPSVKELCKTINASGKIHVQFNSFHQVKLAPSEKIKRHLYHVVQELLQNVIKHAEASQVFIQLYSEPQSIRLMIEDNGKGFDTSKQSKGMGLSNIEDRVKQMNGTMDIDSHIGRGTTVMLEIPA